MEYTHQLLSARLNCELDLNDIAMRSANVIFTNVPFKMLEIRNRSIGGIAKFFFSGKILVHGSIPMLRKYARKIQKLHYPVHLSHIKVLTKSAVYRMKEQVDYQKLVQFIPDLEYHAELFHGCILKKDYISFIIYSTGTVIICGIRKDEDEMEFIWPTILDLEVACS